jgi:hypothetical protein
LLLRQKWCAPPRLQFSDCSIFALCVTFQVQLLFVANLLNLTFRTVLLHCSYILVLTPSTTLPPPLADSSKKLYASFECVY